MPAHRLIPGLLLLAGALLVSGCFSSSLQGSFEMNTTVTNF